MLCTFAFVVVLQFLSVSAQIPFIRPIAGEVINGGVPYVVSVYESLGVPYFGQMKNFSLLLLTGTYTSPTILCAWNLSSTNPASVSPSVTFPRALAPNAVNAFFLGIQGYLISNTSISTTYYSSLFTLQNMTGASSLLPAIPTSTSLQASTFRFPSTTVVSFVTFAPGRSISCISSQGKETVGETGANGGIINQDCESAALGAFAILSKQTRTLTAAASLVTTPPAFSRFAALLAEPASSSIPTASLSSTSTDLSTSPTPSSGIDGIGPATGPTSLGSSSETAKMTYVLVITGITFSTAIILFWIWARYRRNNCALLPTSKADGPPSRCIHAGIECECSRLRKMYDGVVTEFNILRLGSIRSRNTAPHSDITQVEKGLANRDARPGTAGSRNELIGSGSSEIPDNNSQGRRFEDQYQRRRASRASQRSRRSQRTILAELEGDLGPYGQESEDVVPPMPTVNALLTSLHSDLYQDDEDRYESILRGRKKTFVVRRKTMVGEVKTGVFVKGKVAATIVAVRSKPSLSDGGVSKVRIEEGSDLNFPVVLDERLMIYDEQEVESESSRRNGGELAREGVDEKTNMVPKERQEDVSSAEAAIIEAMKQTRLDDLRRERRRKKRSHLAKGGSRDLGIVVPMRSK